MIPVPADLRAAYGRVPWRMSTTCTVYAGGDTSRARTLDVIDGEVSWDETRWPRTEAIVRVPISSDPSTVQPPASPFGDRIGIDVALDVVGVGSFEFRAATLAVAAVDIERPESVATIEAVSFEALVNEDRAASPASTNAGTCSAEITRIVRRTMGGTWPVTVSLSADPTLSAGQFKWDSDTWPVIEAIAELAGAEVYFDASGTLVIKDQPVRPSVAPAITYGVDDTAGTIERYRSSRRWGPNRVGLTYNDGTTTVTGLWEDTVTTSSTRVSGPYGSHTYRETRSMPAGMNPSPANADRAAARLAKLRAGQYRRVELDVVPSPWVLPGDTAQLEFLGGPFERHLVTALRWPLTGLTAQRIVTRDATSTGGPF